MVANQRFVKMIARYMTLLFLTATIIVLVNAIRHNLPSDIAAKSILQGLIQSEKAASTKNTGKEYFCYTDVAQGQWKAYEPISCQYLRDCAGISETEYQQNLSFDELECLQADSKSGQAFWRSKSGVIVLKTIKQHECKTMRKLLRQYCQHVQHGVSCLGNILGLYRVKLRRGNTFYFLVTKNVYHQGASTKVTPSTKYDLKGSTIGRRKCATSTVFKDLDLVYNNQSLTVGPHAKEILLTALYRDSQFLASFNLMDYSLLVEIEEPHMHMLRRFLSHYIHPLSTSRSDKGKLVLLGSDGKIYHFGIIDFLQRYTWRKWFENLLKGLIWDRKKVSCVEPRFYAQRLVKFIDQNSS